MHQRAGLWALAALVARETVGVRGSLVVLACYALNRARGVPEEDATS